MARALHDPAIVARSRRTLLQILRSALAGTAGGLVDLAVLVGLVEMTRLAPAVATLISALVGACINFFLNRGWAFRSRGPILKQGSLYAAATAVWVVLSAIAVHACLAVVRVPYLVARIVADAAVFLTWGFPSSRWIFRPREA